MKRWHDAGLNTHAEAPIITKLTAVARPPKGLGQCAKGVMSLSGPKLIIVACLDKLLKLVNFAHRSLADRRAKNHRRCRS